MGTTHSQADIAASMAAVGSLLKITHDKASVSAVGHAELELEFLALSASRLNSIAFSPGREPLTLIHICGRVRRAGDTRAGALATCRPARGRQASRPGRSACGCSSAWARRAG